MLKAERDDIIYLNITAMHRPPYKDTKIRYVRYILVSYNFAPTYLGLTPEISLTLTGHWSWSDHVVATSQKEAN